MGIRVCLPVSLHENDVGMGFSAELALSTSDPSCEMRFKIRSGVIGGSWRLSSIAVLP